MYKRPQPVQVLQRLLDQHSTLREADQVLLSNLDALVSADSECGLDSDGGNMVLQKAKR